MDSRVRIIGGHWKRSWLPVLDLEGLRPTPDRVREALFNWLGQDLTGWHCLDLFAGTGALGFEAASRGAAGVTLVERHPKLVRSLEAVKARLDARTVAIVRADVMQWLRTTPPRPHDLVLLDPPYHAGWIDRLLPELPAWLAPQGRLYLESEFTLTEERLAAAGAEGLEVIRAAKAGQVHYHLLCRKAAFAPPSGQQHDGEA
jgi:16S rRNA (guanine(966)-N(2))-methyltransferase RsmD